MKKRSEAATIINDRSSCLKTQHKTSKRSLIVYSVLLVAFVVACILLSYAIHSRNSRELDSLSRQNITAQQKIESLVEGNDKLEDIIDELQKENDDLKAKNSDLTDQLCQMRKDWKTEVKKIQDDFKTDFNKLLLENTELKEKLGEISKQS